MTFYVCLRCCTRFLEYWQWRRLYNTIALIAEDTDLLVLLLYYAQDVNKGLYLKNCNNLLARPAGAQMPGPYSRPPWLFAIQQQSTVLQSGHIQLTPVSLMSS